MDRYHRPPALADNAGTGRGARERGADREAERLESAICLGRSISCVGEVICAFYRGEAVEQRADGSPGLVDGSGVGLAQQGLHFCEDLFNRIEVWRVGGQEQEFGFGRADGGANGAALMTSEVVHDDNVAWREDREENLLDISAEACTIDRSVDDAGRGEPVAPQRRQESERLPFAERRF